MNFDEAEDLFSVEPCDGWTAEAIYDRNWALSLLREVLASTEVKYQDSGKGDLFAALCPHLTRQPDAKSLAQAAEGLGMTTGQSKSLLIGFASARQAAEFVSRSASSARDSIEAVAEDHPAIGGIVYAFAVCSVYVTFFLSLFMGIAAPLSVVGGCGLSMLVAYLHPWTTHHPWADRAATVPLWIDTQIRSLWDRYNIARSVTPADTDRSGQHVDANVGQDMD